MNKHLADQFGGIDIYLFDQLLKGTYDGCKSIIDIGCGGGRNMVWFLKNGYEVYGADMSMGAIDNVRSMAAQLAPAYPAERFVVAKAEELPFDSASFDVVICSAVLHFANSSDHFDAMLRSAWRVLKPGGYFFARLASDIGIESLVTPLGEGRYLLPDGSVRYLVNDVILAQYAQQLNGTLYEPIKTTNVNNLRAMTTWCMRKG